MATLSAIELVMKLVGGKWKCLLLYHLSQGDKRARDLMQLLDGISQKVLTEQLRQLENDGLITRRTFPEVPPRVEYSLSEEGKTFVPVLTSMCQWGKSFDERNRQMTTPCGAGQTASITQQSS